MEICLYPVTQYGSYHRMFTVDAGFVCDKATILSNTKYCCGLSLKM